MSLRFNPKNDEIDSDGDDPISGDELGLSLEEALPAAEFVAVADKVAPLPLPLDGGRRCGVEEPESPLPLPEMVETVDTMAEPTPSTHKRGNSCVQRTISY